MGWEYPGISILLRRLPRLATDQTNVLVQNPDEPSLPSAMSIVKAMKGL